MLKIMRGKVALLMTITATLYHMHFGPSFWLKERGLSLKGKASKRHDGRCDTTLQAFLWWLHSSIRKMPLSRGNALLKSTFGQLYNINGWSWTHLSPILLLVIDVGSDLSTTSWMPHPHPFTNWRASVLKLDFATWFYKDYQVREADKI